MLKPEIIAKIRNDIANKVTQSHIAAAYGVSRSLISDIACGRAYKETSGKFNPTDDRILELESEVQLLREENKRAETKVKARAKTAGLFKAVADEMQNRIVPFKALPSLYKPTKKKITEHLVMHLSDGHHDQVVKPEQVGGLERHDFTVACARAEKYVDTTIDFTQGTMSNYRFPSLTVLAYGDFTCGEIHNAVSRSYYRNQFRNCLAIGQLHALMYRDLAPHFQTVNVLYLSGNHGRRTLKKDFYGANENWDFLVAKVAELHCQDIENVNFTIPDAWSANVVINGVGFNVSHGDDVHSNSGIPWYGLTRRQKSLIALNSFQGGPRIRYYCVGHHHNASTLSDVDGELLVNGAWVGTDPFAYNALAGYREPCQWLHGVHAKYGVTWRLGVKLRQETEVPKRYLIAGRREVGLE
jgi:hypothetical protein